jgi:hypothetical protein
MVGFLRLCSPTNRYDTQSKLELDLMHARAHNRCRHDVRRQPLIGLWGAVQHHQRPESRRRRRYPRKSWGGGGVDRAAGCAAVGQLEPRCNRRGAQQVGLSPAATEQAAPHGSKGMRVESGAIPGGSRWVRGGPGGLDICFSDPAAVESTSDETRAGGWGGRAGGAGSRPGRTREGILADPSGGELK